MQETVPLKQLARMRRKVSPHHHGMTEGNRALLRDLDDPQKLQGLLRLPLTLLDEVRCGGSPSRGLARLLRGAVALEILIMAPIRLQNLLSLRLGEDLLPEPRGALTVALAPGQTKNHEPFEAMLPALTSRMLTFYLERYQPLLTGAPCAWLFHQQGGRRTGRGREPALADQEAGARGTGGRPPSARPSAPMAGSWPFSTERACWRPMLVRKTGSRPQC